MSTWPTPRSMEPPDPDTMNALHDELAAVQPMHPGWDMHLSPLGCPWATHHGFTLRADSAWGFHLMIDTWLRSHSIGGAA